MEEWKEIKLKEATDIIGDGIHGTPVFSDDGDFFFVNGNNLCNGEIAIKQDTKRTSLSEYKKYKKELTDRTLFVSINGTIGNTAKYNGEPIVLGKSACYLNVNKDYDYDFIYYIINSPDFLRCITGLATGTTIKNVSLKTIREYSFKAPSKEKQTKIAEVLKSLDDKITLNNRINHNLEQQAQTLFKSWFVDFEPFKQERFVNTEMGLIPKDWSIVPFFDIVRLCSGGTPKTEQPDYWGGNIPFFTPKDVSISPFCLKTEKYITKSGLDHCNSHLYEPFTTFITARGTVGKLCMAGYPMAMNQTNYAICSISIDPILAFLFSKQIVNNLKNKANGAVFDAITTRDFEGERIIMAPENILSKFSSTIRPLYNQILENEKQSLELAKTRDLVLPALMTGQTINHNC